MSDKPLWMPVGSVRAILALVIVISAVVAVFVLPAEAAGLLLALTGAVLVYYFESRKEG